MKTWTCTKKECESVCVIVTPNEQPTYCPCFEIGARWKLIKDTEAELKKHQQKEEGDK